LKKLRVVVTHELDRHNWCFDFGGLKNPARPYRDRRRVALGIMYCNVIMCAVRPSRHEPFKTVMLVASNVTLIYSSGCVCPMLKKVTLLLLSWLSVYGTTLSANAACISLKQTSSLSFEGALSYHIFAGPPNYEDVRKGDTPKPAYILKLDGATGDDFLNPEQPFAKIHVYPAETNGTGHALWRDLRQLVGKRL
jgi:hypothetical protein